MLSRVLAAAALPAILSWNAPARADADAGVDAAEAGSTDAGADASLGPWDVLAAYCSDTELECTLAKLDYQKTVSLPIAFDFDTGWVPQGSDLQLRFFLKVPASTTVELDGFLQTKWPQAMTLATPGGSHGLLKFDYGLDLGAKAKLDVNVIGVPVKWEGDIPFVPQVNFHLKAEKTFTPWAFEPDVATATGSSPKLRMFEVNLLDLVGIPSQLSKGGVALDVAGDLSATYHTDRIRIEPAKVTESAITSAGGTTEREFTGGAFVEYDVFPEGRVDYKGALHLIPTFFIKVLGKDFSLPLVDIPVAVPLGKQDFVFDPVRVHVPLPDLDGVAESLSFGQLAVGETKTLSLDLSNIGEAKARATGFLDASKSKVFALPKTEVFVESQKSATFSVSFTPDRVGKQSSVLTLVTNDPDERFFMVTLTGEGLGDAPPVDAGLKPADEAGDDGGCGCRPRGGPTEAPVALMGLALLWGFRRRNRLDRNNPS